MHRKTSSIPPSSINCYLLNLPCITLKSWDTFFQRAVSSSSKIHHPYKFFPPKHSLNQLPSIGLFGLFDFGREWGTTSSVSDLQPQPRLDPSTKGSASEPRGVTALVRIDETLVTETQPEMMASQNQLRPKISIGKAGKACYLDFGWYWFILWKNIQNNIQISWCCLAIGSNSKLPTLAFLASYLAERKAAPCKGNMFFNCHVKSHQYKTDDII